MKVWVLIIDHKHGTNASVHLSQAEAEKANQDFCDEWFEEEYPDEEKPSDPAEMASRYWDLQSERGEEWHSIEPCETTGDITVPPIFVPANPHGVKPGYYTRPDIVRLLRLHKMFPERVQFIADMME